MSVVITQHRENHLSVQYCPEGLATVPPERKVFGCVCVPVCVYVPSMCTEHKQLVGMYSPRTHMHTYDVLLFYYFAVPFILAFFFFFLFIFSVSELAEYPETECGLFLLLQNLKRQDRIKKVFLHLLQRAVLQERVPKTAR